MTTLTAEVDVATAFLREVGCRVLLPFTAGARTFTESTSDAVRVAAIVDVETTGLDESAEIVQIAIQRAFYAEDVLLSVTAPWVRFNEPSKPIPAEVTAIHGITDEMVRGHSVSAMDVQLQLNGVGLLIAHNAGFDAPIFARSFPNVRAYAWACSLEDVPWREHYESARLGSLLQDHTQQHFQGHDAGRDVAAVAEILATPFADGRSPFAMLLANARTPRVRIEAVGAPFETKDTLKARGYRWNPTRRTWATQIAALDEFSEVEWLRALGARPVVTHLDARNRFL